MRQPSSVGARQIHEIRMTGEARAVVVRRQSAPSTDYELLVGETDWQAALAAQLPSIPARICEAPELAALLDRLELLGADPRRNPIVTADVLRKLCDLLPHPERDGSNIPHRTLADLSGLPRPQVTRYLLLLALPQEVRQLLARGHLTFGHGWALCGQKVSQCPDHQISLAKQVIQERWSVRRLEREVSGEPEAPALRPGDGPIQPSPPTDLVQDPNLAQLANSLSEKTGMPVTIEHQANGTGRIIFRYFSIDETEGLLRHLPTNE
jgi:ParB family chromosome partitioning protein